MKDNSKKNLKNDYNQTFYKKILEKSKDIKSKKNCLYFLSIILLNLCTIIVAWFIESNNNGSVDSQTIFSGYNWKYLYIIISILIIIILLKTFPDYLLLYSKNRQRKFLSMLNGNIKNDFYNSVTIYSRGGYPVYVSQVESSGVNAKIVTDIAYGKKFFNKISFLIYSFLIIILGCCFVFDKSIIWFLIAGICGFLINCIIVIFVLYFDRTKEKYLKVIGSLSKLLYKLRIVKDYEKFYTQTVEKLVVYNTSLKSNKRIIVLQIISGILVTFLRHLLLFIVLLSLNNGDTKIMMTILFRITLLDLIIEVLPLSRGTLIFEIIFISLFSSVFFEGYVLWGMLIYRILDYFIYGIMFLISLIFDFVIKGKNKKQSKIIQEN